MLRFWTRKLLQAEDKSKKYFDIMLSKMHRTLEYKEEIKHLQAEIWISLLMFPKFGVNNFVLPARWRKVRSTVLATLIIIAMITKIWHDQRVQICVTYYPPNFRRSISSWSRLLLLFLHPFLYILYFYGRISNMTKLVNHIVSQKISVVKSIFRITCNWYPKKILSGLLPFSDEFYK